MFIPSIYLLFAAEFLIVLLGLSSFLIYYVMKLRNQRESSSPAPEQDTPDLTGTSYAEYLEQQLLRNEARAGVETNLEQNDDNQTSDTETSDAESTTDPEAVADTATSVEQPEGSEDENNQHSRLLHARELFLKLERDAAAHDENEHAFWDSIFKGMEQVLEEFSTVTVEQEVMHETSVEHTQKSSEKVFYIETQGKKIDGEVNKLKDIIYEQENILSSLRKSISDAEGHFPEGSDELDALRAQFDSLERQLSDSKMCMEVLELENDRLQQEVHNLEGQVTEGGTESGTKPDLGEMKEVMDKQAEQISELQATIDGLELEAEQAEKLRATLNSFTRTSEEMMGCITILEEENEHLKEQLDHPTEAEAEVDAETEANTDSENNNDELKSRIKNLEEEVIKKEVEYAKLQDEFTSMEKEYLAMYEAMHGTDN